jgi:hypothetical protein
MSMLLTEEQAKQKWCPHYRVAICGGGESTYSEDNRPMEFEQDADEKTKWRPTGLVCRPARCIASGCMAWRWFDSVSDDGTRCHRKPTDMARREPEPHEGRPLNERRGFCGLAGKP